VNRQTLVVTAGTVVLLLIGAVLLYASPPTGGEAEPTRAVAKAKAKAQPLAPAKAKNKAAPPKPQQVFTRAIPADRPAAPEGAPNIVVVMAAATRRDQTSPYGGPSDVTPFLDSVAVRGLRFDDALANGVWPKVAQAALLTGSYPHEVAMVQIDGQTNERRLGQESTTLAERLADGGYTTVGATGSIHLNGRYGMRQGFDWYREAPASGYDVAGRLESKAVVGAGLLGVRSRKDKDRPVYVQLSFIDAHKPFRVPPDEFKRFDAPDHNVSPYRAMLRRQDDALASLVRGLKTAGLDESNTVFVFVGEHGEGLSMPPAHRKQHGRMLFGSSVQIPWVMWGAGVAEGATVTGLVSQIDLAPTLVALAGLPVDGMSGMSHASLLAAGGASKRDQHYVDTLLDKAHRASVWSATHQCQRDYGSDTVAGEVFVDGCFDRVADPDFTKVVEAPLIDALDPLHDKLLEAHRAVDRARAAADRGE